MTVYFKKIFSKLARFASGEPRPDTPSPQLQEIEELKGSLQRRIQDNEVMAAISQALGETYDLERIFQLIVDSARKVIPGVERAVIHLLEEENQVLRSVAISGFESEGAASASLRRGEGVAGQVIDEGSTINVGDIHRDPRYIRLGKTTPMRSLLVAPVQTRHHRLGTLSLQSDKPNAFSTDDERLVTTLGVQAALAIENASLFTTAEETLKREQAARAHLVQSEKLAAVGRLTASVAHELNNPLQAMQAALFLIQRDPGLSEQSVRDVGVVLDEMERMAKLISMLRETYRPAAINEYVPDSINSLVAEVRTLIDTHLRQNRVDFQFHPDPQIPPILMIRDQIKQVLLNLSLNAVEGMASGGRLVITSQLDPGSRGVWLIVSDDGVGIEPADLPNIFDPFYTTKEKGTGLGLAISYDIIRRHGGQVTVESEVGRGATFRIWLPADSTLSVYQEGS